MQLSRMERVVVSRREEYARRAREQVQKAREKALGCLAKCLPPPESEPEALPTEGKSARDPLV